MNEGDYTLDMSAYNRLFGQSQQQYQLENTLQLSQGSIGSTSYPMGSIIGVPAVTSGVLTFDRHAYPETAPPGPETAMRWLDRRVDEMRVRL